MVLFLLGFRATMKVMQPDPTMESEALTAGMIINAFSCVSFIVSMVGVVYVLCWL